MSESEVYEKIKELIVDQFGIDENNIKRESSISDDLAADSLDIVELIMQIEETFDIQIPDSDTESLKTVDDLVKYIANRE